MPTRTTLPDRAGRFADLAEISLTSTRELCKLADLARDNAADGAFVEIGSYKGASALAILEGQAEAGKRPLSLFCVDRFEQDTRREFERRVRRYLDSGEVVLWAGTSQDFAASWPTDRQIAYLFIDGDHRYEGVRRDLESFLPRLAPGATLILHDCFYRPSATVGRGAAFFHMGVSRAARELVVSSSRFGRFEREGTMLIAHGLPGVNPSNESAQQRATFVAEFERLTALHNWRLRMSYASFLLAGAVYATAKRLCLAPLVRAGLRRLGIRSLFGRAV